MNKAIMKIIKESACYEEIWVTVDEKFGDDGINVLEAIAEKQGWLDEMLEEIGR
ncbi:MAG: hypothetical protein IJJ44_12575 [Solobacterium sp.]|nr:hypothetical protein [Solobacterium sp.]